MSGWAASHPKSQLGEDPLSGPLGGLAGFRPSQAQGLSSLLAVAQEPSSDLCHLVLSTGQLTTWQLLPSE